MQNYLHGAPARASAHRRALPGGHLAQRHQHPLPRPPARARTARREAQGGSEGVRPARQVWWKRSPPRDEAAPALCPGPRAWPRRADSGLGQALLTAGPGGVSPGEKEEPVCRRAVVSDRRFPFTLRRNQTCRGLHSGSPAPRTAGQSTLLWALVVVSCSSCLIAFSSRAQVQLTPPPPTAPASRPVPAAPSPKPRLTSPVPDECLLHSLYCRSGHLHTGAHLPIFVSLLLIHQRIFFYGF